MIRLFGIAFALVVAFSAATFINGATENASETFRASFHHSSADNR